MYWTKKHVMVCTAVHCNQKGAMDVAGRLRLAVLRKGVDADILVNNCGTIDLCDCGPNIVVYPDNVIYNGVTVKDIPEIMTHLEGGPVVERLVLSVTSEDEVRRKAYYAEALSREGGQPPDEADALAATHGFDDQWIAEQLRRGFMARKPHPESGKDRILVTKKAKDRYSL